MAFGNLVANLMMKTKNFVDGARKARGELGKISKASKELNSVLSVVGAGFSAAIVVSKFNQMRNEIDKTAKTASKLGMSGQGLMQMHHAAKLSGIEVTKLNTAMQRMVRRVSEVASTGRGSALGVLGELGLDAKELNNLSPDKMLGKIADAFGNVQNQSDKVRIAFGLFDTEGVDMVNMLANGSAGLREMAAEFDKLHGVMTEADFANIQQMNDDITRMQAQWEGFARTLTGKVAPALTSVMKSLTAFTSTLSGLSFADMANLINPTTTLQKQLEILNRMVDKKEELDKAGNSPASDTEAKVKAAEDRAKTMKENAENYEKAMENARVDQEKILGIHDEIRTKLQSLRDQGWNEKQLRSLELILRKNEKLTKEKEKQAKAEQKQQELIRKAENMAASIKDRHKTPEDRLRERMENIAALENSGDLRFETADAERKAARKDFLSAKHKDGGQSQALSAARRGSQEALQRIVDRMRGKDKKDLEKQQLDRLKTIADGIQDVVNALNDNEPFTVGDING